ncbi:sugar ABC transporter permease [Actinomyces sp. MRS3W]|uniref:carbohydrate ABC transporter permease n=1 Tax=Actinomyces sp. MRS3W TaxID=2800796 RepID=UPI0028FD1158|nr:sugar ABC transporter permease [Actinomyces sp. MRS3W]MDU0348027.1 sugar ABC transporter permease [Actinomyces sp. MRS3W]
MAQHTPLFEAEQRHQHAVWREWRRGGAFVAPTVLMLVLFFIVPIVLVIVMSVSKWTLLGGRMGVAFPDNFRKILADPLLGQSVIFTLKYTVVTTVILQPIAVGLALLIQQSRRWNSIVRTAILLPAALGIASASLLFYAIYSPQVGPVTKILAAVGLADAGNSVLGTPNGALVATVVLVVWRFAGYYMILTMVGVQAIPNEVYEAAKIDGAGWWRTFTDVTFPLLKPTLAMTTIMSITGSLLAFDQFFILTKGGPNNATMTVVQLIYKYAFETKRDLGMAAALSVLVLVALVAINALQLKAMGVTDSEEER